MKRRPCTKATKNIGHSAAIMLVGFMFVGLAYSQVQTIRYDSTLKSSAVCLHKDIGALYDDCCMPQDSLAPQRALIERQCTMITNGHFFMPFCHPTVDKYDFTAADRIADFAREKKLRMRGHTLLWHEQIPGWLTNVKRPRAQSRSLVKDHITTVVSHYKGRMDCWDVVNEAVDDNGQMRNSEFAALLGQSYIADAFTWAHEADSAALLFYNDCYIEEINQKSDSVYALLKGLRTRGVPVHGVGFQCHLAVGQPVDFESIRKNIDRFAALGLIVHFTEVDIRIKLPVSPEKVRLQETLYKRLARVFADSPSCRAIVFWGFADRHSWIDRTIHGYGSACLFDKVYQPKSAFNVFTDEISSACRAQSEVERRGLKPDWK